MFYGCCECYPGLRSNEMEYIFARLKFTIEITLQLSDKNMVSLCLSGPLPSYMDCCVWHGECR